MRKEVEFTVRFVFDDRQPLTSGEEEAFAEMMALAAKFRAQQATPGLHRKPLVPVPCEGCGRPLAGPGNKKQHEDVCVALRESAGMPVLVEARA